MSNEQVSGQAVHPEPCAGLWRSGWGGRLGLCTYGALVPLGAPPLAAGACVLWEREVCGWRGALLPLSPVGA